MTAKAKNGLTFATAPDVLTVAQTAGLLHVGCGVVYKVIADGSLPAVRVGTKTLRIAKAAVIRFVDSSKNENAEAVGNTSAKEVSGNDRHNPQPR